MRIVVLSRVLLCLTAFCLAPRAWAQVWFGPSSLQVAGKAPALAAAGGMNAPQFSQGDLDGDGSPELAVFDRSAESWQVFRYQGGAWIYAPDLVSMLPHCYNWALLRDYNGDGLLDLFTSNTSAVALYRNELGPGGARVLTQVSDAVPTTTFAGGSTSLTITQTDVPGILDMDGDGDLDVITFELGGVTVEFHRNQSINNGTGNLNDIRFKKEACWGRFSESPNICSQYFFGLTCRVGIEDSSLPAPLATQHVGSTELPFDADGDGDLDVLIGDVSCSDMTLLVNNAGPGAPPNMTSQITPWPPAGSGRPGSIELFPAPFRIDIDLDGVQDLVAAPNLYGVSFGESPQLARSVYAYRNAAPNGQVPDYRFATDGFLQSDMLDGGSEASPCWIDLDGDGDKDLILSTKNRLYRGDTLSAGMAWYRREGTGLTLADTNLLGYLARRYNFVQPTAADLNGDGITDLVLMYGQSFRAAKAIYLPGTTSLNATGTVLRTDRADTLNFPFQPGDWPAFVDYDTDGDLDMVLGRDDGSLGLVDNLGNRTVPSFGAFQSGFLGQVAGLHYACKPAVADVDNNGQPDVLVTLGDRALRLFRNPLFLIGTAATADSMLYQNNTLQRADPLPRQNWNAPVLEDLDGDNLPDLTLGTTLGGLQQFENRLNQPLAARPSVRLQARLLGNPSPTLSLQLGQPATVRVTDVLGRPLLQARLGAGTHPALLAAPTPGFYQVQVLSGEAAATLRWIAP